MQAVAQMALLKMLLYCAALSSPGDILFEVRSLMWPGRSLNGTIFDIRSRHIYNRLLSLYPTLTCAWLVRFDAICH
jgi:hypothetical protein